MVKNLDKSVSSIENLLLFYNKYLALDNDEAFLINLITKMTSLYNAKIPAEKADRVYDLGIEALKYTENDFMVLSAFESKCLNFWERAVINIAEDITINIDSFGNILSVESHLPNMDRYVGTDVNALLDEFVDMPGYAKAKRDVSNVIMQNILASKLYKAVSEQIRKTKGMYAANAFMFVNYNVVNYENTLANKLENKEQINHEFSRARSQR